VLEQRVAEPPHAEPTVAANRRVHPVDRLVAGLGSDRAGEHAGAAVRVEAMHELGRAADDEGDLVQQRERVLFAAALRLALRSSLPLALQHAGVQGGLRPRPGQEREQVERVVPRAVAGRDAAAGHGLLVAGADVARSTRVDELPRRVVAERACQRVATRRVGARDRGMARRDRGEHLGGGARRGYGHSQTATVSAAASPTDCSITTRA
jgi:hypothetical protein